MSSVTSKQWETAIREARQYVANYDKTRWLIVKIALRVCDITHGGNNKNVYTLARFADEIEINDHTLYEWVRMKRYVIDKLPKGVQAAPHKNTYAHYKEVLDRVNKDTTVREVRDIFLEVGKEDPRKKKFLKYNKVLNSISYNAQRPIRMAEIPAEHILDMIKKMKLITALLNKELELREKFGDSVHGKAKRLNLKKEIADQLDNVVRTNSYEDEN